MIPVETPRRYAGEFGAMSRRHVEALSGGRAALCAFPVPEIVRASFLALVNARPQPAFVLYPLMYLDLAEATGGLTPRHRDYLPWMMLAMELVALYDDTVDYTPCRSGTPTYTARFGAANAAVLSGFLYSVLAEQTARLAPEAAGLLHRAFAGLCSCEVWEHEARYPEISEASFVAWTDQRKAAVTAIDAYGLDSVLLMHGLSPIEGPVHVAFGDLQQEIDDLVSILEAREGDGENDDLKMGIPCHALVATLRAAPQRTRALLSDLWQPYRALAPQLRHGTSEARARIDAATAEVHRELVALILQHGVGPTIDKVLADAAFVAAGAPDHARARLRAYTYSFVDRLREVDARTRIEANL